MFATMQSLNFPMQSDKLIMDRVKKVMAHTGFAVKLAKAGMKFMIELVLVLGELRS